MRRRSHSQTLIATLSAVALLYVLVPAPAAQASGPAAGEEPVPAEAAEAGYAPVAEAGAATTGLQSCISVGLESAGLGARDVCEKGCTPGNEQEDCLHQISCFMNPYSCNDASSAPCSGTCGCSVV